MTGTCWRWPANCCNRSWPTSPSTQFFKSRLSDESADWCRFGIAGGDGSLVSLGLDLSQAADSIVRGNGLIAIRLPDGRAELWAPNAEAEQVRTRLSAQLGEVPVNRWLLDQVRAGIGESSAARASCSSRK